MISTWSNSMVNINVNENKGKCLEVRFWEECVCVCEKEIEGERERESNKKPSKTHIVQYSYPSKYYNLCEAQEPSSQF